MFRLKILTDTLPFSGDVAFRNTEIARHLREAADKLETSPMIFEVADCVIRQDGITIGSWHVDNKPTYSL